MEEEEKMEEGLVAVMAEVVKVAVKEEVEVAAEEMKEVAEEKHLTFGRVSLMIAASAQMELKQRRPIGCYLRAPLPWRRPPSPPHCSLDPLPRSRIGLRIHRRVAQRAPTYSPGQLLS
jgi:hypothetical protein